MSTWVQLGQPLYFWSGSTPSFFPTTIRLLRDHVYSLWINNNPNVHVILTFLYTQIRGTVKLRISHLCTAIGALPSTSCTASLKPQSLSNSGVCELKLSPMGICAVPSVDSLKKWGVLTQKPASQQQGCRCALWRLKNEKFTLKSTHKKVLFKKSLRNYTLADFTALKVWKSFKLLVSFQEKGKTYKHS